MSSFFSLLLLLFFFFFFFFFFLFFFSSTRERSKPTTDAHCEPAPLRFLSSSSLPPFLLFPLSRGLFGRERSSGRPRREREGEREKRRNSTSWPKLFSEIRRFFRASSEMIFARINPYGRHGNRSASALSTPDVQSLGSRPPESSNGRGGLLPRLQLRVSANAFLPFFFPESLYTRPYLSTSLLPSSTCLYEIPHFHLLLRWKQMYSRISSFTKRVRVPSSSFCFSSLNSM